MKEVPQIYSDGTTLTSLEGQDNFAGYNLDYLLQETLKTFAQKQIEHSMDIPYDRRILEASKRGPLTTGLIDRYLQRRGIYNINIILRQSGRFDGEVYLYNL